MHSFGAINNGENNDYAAPSIILQPMLFQFLINMM